MLVEATKAGGFGDTISSMVNYNDYHKDDSTGARIAWARKRKGMKGKELAAAPGMHPVTISNFERGTDRPSLDALQRIAAVLGVSIGWLLMEPEPEAGPVFFSPEADDAAQLVGQFIDAAPPEERARLLALLRAMVDVYVTKPAQEERVIYLPNGPAHPQPAQGTRLNRSGSLFLIFGTNCQCFGLNWCLTALYIYAIISP